MREEAHRRRGATAKSGNPEPKRKINDKLTENRRLSTSLCVAKKRHENDRKRIFGEALNEAVKKKRSGRSTSAVEDAGRTRNGSKKAPVPDTCQKTPVR